MSTGKVTKVDLMSRVYKLKTALFDGKHHNKSDDWKDGAHHSLNQILDILNEYVQ